MNISFEIDKMTVTVPKNIFSYVKWDDDFCENNVEP